MNNKKFAIISIFAAIIVVLQVISTYVNFGSFSITLTLIPIIVAGAVYGIGIGALMGLVFGIVVSIMVIAGADPNGAIMFASHPVITISTCLLKGAVAGAIGSLIYNKVENKKLAILLDAVITPILNTTILYISLILFFDSSFTTMITAFMSINFILEFLINILLAPRLTNLINRAKSRDIK